MFKQKKDNQKKTNAFYLLVLLFGLLINSNSIAEPQAVYIDVRTWAEYQIDHIDGDTRIHVSDIVQGVSQKYPDKNTPIRLYCRSGVRSGSALEKLNAAGYLDVQNLGGIDDARRKRGIK